MRILVCVKRVPIPGARIPVTDDGQRVDDALLGHTISPHEECAVEEAVQLVEAHGGESVVLTLGAADADEQVRYAVSLGINRGVLVETDGGDWDPQRTAAALVEAITTLEDEDGPFDLVLFGNESADAGGFQVGIRVATALGRPIVQGVKDITISGEVGDGTVRVQRPTGNASEVYELPLPACLGVREGLNLPRYPTMRGRLQARKAEVATAAAADVGPGGQALVALQAPPEQVRETEVLGDGPDGVDRVIEVLTDLKVLP
jgi:electron transfer flavoprotein beta subunit